MSQIRYAARSLEPAPETPATDTPKMWSKTLVAFYETDPEIIAAVLPPPLVPTDEPLVRVNVAQVDFPNSDFTLGAGVFSVQCRHGDEVGLYDLLMVMTSEQAVIGGREIYGEPKKIGDVRLERDGDELVGSMSRMGVTFIELRGTAVEPLPLTGTTERVSFYLKFLLDPEGGGFDSDPSLVHCHRTEDSRVAERVEGEIILRDSDADPVVDLPVRRIVSMRYSENNTTQRGVIVEKVDGDLILPYAHQRYDSLSPTLTAKSRPAVGV